METLQGFGYAERVDLDRTMRQSNIQTDTSKMLTLSQLNISDFTYMVKNKTKTPKHLVHKLTTPVD
jgi:hypothetical protein